MPTTIDEVVESAARGVLRALDARNEGNGRTEKSDAASLVSAGFSVDFRIRAGGIPNVNPADLRTFLNPQPLPPFHGGDE